MTDFVFSSLAIPPQGRDTGMPLPLANALSAVPVIESLMPSVAGTKSAMEQEPKLVTGTRR